METANAGEEINELNLASRCEIFFFDPWFLFYWTTIAVRRVLIKRRMSAGWVTVPVRENWAGMGVDESDLRLDL